MQNQPIRSYAQPINNPTTSTNCRGKFKGKSSLDYPPDTVEISAENKIKKQGMSTGMKVLLGIAGTAVAAYGCVVGHRTLNKPSIEKVAKNFSEIFRRDVSKEEAQKLAKEYKEIFSIKDKDEFCKKIFEQIKKDYGYEKADIPLVFENLGAVKENGNIVWAHWNPFYDNVAINTEALKPLGEKLNKFEQQKICNTLVHEFQHVKQGEYAARTNMNAYLNQLCSDKTAPEKTLFILEDAREFMTNSLLNNKELNFKTKEEVESFIDKAIQQLKDGSYKSDNIIMDIISSVKNDRQKAAKSIFGQYEKFKPNSEEYKKGLSYLDCYKTYNNNNTEIYNNAIIEKEAFGTEDKIAPLYKYIASIWRL